MVQPNDFLTFLTQHSVAEQHSGMRNWRDIIHNRSVEAATLPSKAQQAQTI